jgi:acylpyruvate hydrolase
MKIICVGRNYADHAKELNNPVPEFPLLFLKPETALLPKNNPFYIPDFTKDVHYEVELVIRINRLGKHISEKHAHSYFDEIGVGIDFTARDVQQRCKEAGHPWEIGKAFDHSAPVSSKFINVSELPDLNNISFYLTKNGETVQKGNSGQMIFSFEKIIAYVSQYFTLKIGDLIFTGTPSGVGPVAIGDQLQAFVENQSFLKVNVR